MNENLVSVIKSNFTKYPEPPFNPPKNFPELDISETDETNVVFESVRKNLYKLGLDKENFGTPYWNPLQELIKPMDKVVLKPNLVYHSHRDGKEGLEAMVTHASILRPIIDYILKATNREAKITICDVPLQSASWEKIIEMNNYDKLIKYYEMRKIKIDILDLRLHEAICNKFGLIIKLRSLPGDPKGNCVVDLGKFSCFQDIASHSKKLMITDYKPGSVGKHHNTHKNEYLIPRTILESDVFINLPKMKTHKKAGVTISLKNLVGINADKGWIAHHRKGRKKNGGDEYDFMPLTFWIQYHLVNYLKQFKLGVFLLTYLILPMRSIASSLKDKYFSKNKKGKKYIDPLSKYNQQTIISEGSWYLNDTLWRTIIDLNRCLFYADNSGKLHHNKQRKYLTIVDGLFAMEGDGPFDGNSHNSGCLIGSSNPVSSDYISALLMGFDPKKIPSIYECFKLTNFTLVDFEPNKINIKSNTEDFVDIKNLKWNNSLKFTPPNGWVGYIEND